MKDSVGFAYIANMENAENFKPGDVVQLKSGGPVMTVLAIFESDSVVRCQWFPFDRNSGYSNEPIVDSFQPHMLASVTYNKGAYFVKQDYWHRLPSSK